MGDLTSVDIILPRPEDGSLKQENFKVEFFLH